MNGKHWYHWHDDTLQLALHIQPRARHDEFVGPHGDALKLRITAPPVDGKANAHLLKFLAQAFGVARQQVQLLSGETGRQKRVAIVAPKRIPAALEEWLKPRQY